MPNDLNPAAPSPLEAPIGPLDESLGGGGKNIPPPKPPPEKG